MSAEALNALALQSSGAAIGTFLGVLVGLSLRRRRGGAQTGILAASPFVMASAAGGIALIVAMAFNYLTA